MAVDFKRSTLVLLLLILEGEVKIFPLTPSRRMTEYVSTSVSTTIHLNKSSAHLANEALVIRVDRPELIPAGRVDERAVDEELVWEGQ